MKRKGIQSHSMVVKKADFVQFRNDLASTDFDKCFVENNVDISCESFLNVACTHVPNTIITV